MVVLCAGPAPTGLTGAATSGYQGLTGAGGSLLGAGTGTANSAASIIPTLVGKRHLLQSKLARLHACAHAFKCQTIS